MGFRNAVQDLIKYTHGQILTFVEDRSDAERSKIYCIVFLAKSFNFSGTSLLLSIRAKPIQSYMITKIMSKFIEMRSAELLEAVGSSSYDHNFFHHLFKAKLE